MSYVTKYSGTPVFSVWVNGNTVDYGNGAPPRARRCGSSCISWSGATPC